MYYTYEYVHATSDLRPLTSDLRFFLSAPMLPELTQDEVAAGLECVAAMALAQAELEEPPVNAIALAQALGLGVSFDDDQSGRARTVRLRACRGESHGSILVHSDPRLERLHWAVAHEIGEHLAASAFQQLGMDVREAPPG